MHKLSNSKLLKRTLRMRVRGLGRRSSRDQDQASVSACVCDRVSKSPFTGHCSTLPHVNYNNGDPIEPKGAPTNQFWRSGGQIWQICPEVRETGLEIAVKSQQLRIISDRDLSLLRESRGRKVGFCLPVVNVVQIYVLYNIDVRLIFYELVSIYFYDQKKSIWTF